jgi:hypothetical protein
MSSFCTRYDASGTVWPVSNYPGALFPLQSQGQYATNKDAWTFFELVESTDAATRVYWSNQGGYQPPGTSAFPQTPSLWYPLQSQSELQRYQAGQQLHVQACPAYNWASQRSLGIPIVPLTNVYPAAL